MSTIRLDCDPTVAIRLRRSARVRRLSLRVSALDGAVTMTIPPRLPVSEAVAFAQERLDWIREARARSDPPRPIDEGIFLPVEGTPRLVVLTDRRTPQLDDRSLTLPRRRPGPAAGAFLKLLARDRLAASCDRHASAAGVDYAAISLRDTRSRWGSCSTAGRLMFSWRLAMAPSTILDYVAAHEVAHRRHMDHSAAFWRTVAALVPDWRVRRAWLREHGAGLHAFRFES